MQLFKVFTRRDIPVSHLLGPMHCENPQRSDITEGLGKINLHHEYDKKVLCFYIR
mgnify:CR=1 FL=1